MARHNGTKRKTSNVSSKPRPQKRSDARMKKWNTADDIPMEEEDQFHASKDKILLEGDGHGDDDDGDEEEVFALEGMDDESGDEGYDEDDFEEAAPVEAKPPKSKKKEKKSKKKATSDDERKSDSDEEEGWGQGRAAYYSSNAAQIESDDEEGHELEEQEAKRLQIKNRTAFNDDDFGLNDAIEIQATLEQDDFTEPIPSALPSLPTDKKELLRQLQKTNPECLALARDWEDAVHDLQETQTRVQKMEMEHPDHVSLETVHIYYQTLLSYCTMLAFYLHLCASPKYAQRPAVLREHPILKRLLTLKQSLITLEDVDFAASGFENEDEYDMEEDMKGLAEISIPPGSIWEFARQRGLEPNELMELLHDVRAPAEDTIPPTMSKESSKSTNKPPKKKRRTVEEQRPQDAQIPTFDLVEPEYTSSKPSSSKDAFRTLSGGDAYGEAMALHEVDAADKSARKKTLRFHTSKIESASARRQGARNQSMGGDDDIPYRDRKNEKEARAVREAVRRSGEGGADLDDEDPEPRAGSKRSRGSDGEDDGHESPDDYYELVKKKSKDRKEKKKAEYEEEHGRTRVVEEEEGAGPRSLTRAILKNRGLTPHRSKSVRNPRVKKRQKYEKAKKKVSSQKAVFKGGLSASGGRYEGEKSGISKVVKSVRLG